MYAYADENNFMESGHAVHGKEGTALKNGEKKKNGYAKQGFGVVNAPKTPTTNTPKPTVIKSDKDLRAKK